MKELIKVTYDNDRPTVLGRALHEALEVKTRYNDWFSRMCEYGFTEGTDFYSILSKTSDNGRPSTDHQLTIDMAKELCMLQRTDKGKEFRRYFIEVERKWNSPEAVLERAKQMHQSTLKKPLTLASVNNACKILGVALDQAGMEPAQKVLAFQQLYRKAGIDLNLTFPAEERFYFLEDIAKELGMMSKNGNPHAHAVGAIIRKLSLDADEKQLVRFERNGHPDNTEKYSQSALEKVKAWLGENQYPATIHGETRNFTVKYLKEA